MKRKSYYGKTILLLIISIVYTVLVSVVDKQAIGPEGTCVGFSAINKVVLDLISYNPMWDKVTDIMLMIAILTAAYFAVTGLMQLVKEKRRIMEKVEEADLLVFTTPTYCSHASAGMKTFIDLTFTYFMIHKPRKAMFSKKAVVFSTASGAGTKSAIKDITHSLFYWGVPYIKTYGRSIAAMNWTG